MLAPTGKNIPNILSFLLSQRYEQSPPKEPVFKEVETSVFLPLFEEEYKKNFIQTNFKVGVLHSPMEGKCGETNLYEQGISFSSLTLDLEKKNHKITKTGLLPRD
jgi:hypothetical protein